MLMGPRPGVRSVCGPRVESWLLGKRWQVTHPLRFLYLFTVHERAALAEGYPPVWPPPPSAPAKRARE